MTEIKEASINVDNLLRDSRRITDDERNQLLSNIKTVEGLNSAYGTRMQYPLEEEGPRGYLQEIETSPDSEQSIRFGKNYLIERGTTMTDFYVHILSEEKNLRFVHFIDGEILIKITNGDDSKELLSIEKPLDEMTESEFEVENNALKAIVGASLSPHRDS